jgi:hypothetical protein
MYDILSVCKAFGNQLHVRVVVVEVESCIGKDTQDTYRNVGHRSRHSFCFFSTLSSFCGPPKNLDHTAHALVEVGVWGSTETPAAELMIAKCSACPSPADRSIRTLSGTQTCLSSLSAAL